MVQIKSVVFTIVYTGVLSFILLKITSVVTGGLRVSEEPTTFSEYTKIQRMPSCTAHAISIRLRNANAVLQT